MIGHIMIDYRITAAMHNLFHKPLIPDGEHTISVAKKIRQKALSKVQKNPLEIICKLPFGGKNFPEFPLKDIHDFPKIDPKEIATNITYGNYYLNQAKMYLDDLLTNPKIYILRNKPDIKKTPESSLFVKSLEKTKVIGVEFKSRHMRGSDASVYKTMIQYIPGEANNTIEKIDIKKNNYLLIKGTIRVFFFL